MEKEEYEITPYLPEHYPENQREWAAPGVPLNPHLRDRFDSTPNDERDALELHHWWGLVYIVTAEWQDTNDSQNAQWRKRWFEVWPTGIRYTVRCLDGGAWDRSTNKGGYPTLEQALVRAAELGGTKHDQNE